MLFRSIPKYQFWTVVIWLNLVLCVSAVAQRRDTTIVKNIEYTGSSTISQAAAIDSAKSRAIALVKSEYVPTLIVSYSLRYIHEINKKYEDDFKRETYQLELYQARAVIVDATDNVITNTDGIPYTNFILRVHVRVTIIWDEGIIKSVIAQVAEKYKFGHLQLATKMGCLVSIDKTHKVKINKDQVIQQQITLGEPHTLQIFEFASAQNPTYDTTFTVEPDQTFSLTVPWWQDVTFAFIDGGMVQLDQTVFTVPDFMVLRYEVTHADYMNFLNSTNHSAPYHTALWAANHVYKFRKPQEPDNRPVVLVDKDDALAYCKWLTDNTGITHRLPTYVEWMYLIEKELGNETRHGWYADNAGSHSHAEPANPEAINGVYNLLGNVCEWVMDDMFDSAAELPLNAAPFIDSYGSKLGIVMGGSWQDSRNNPTLKKEMFRTDRRETIGFRVVRVVE